MAIRVVSWNIGKRHEPWRQLLDMDVDVALLQEASEPPDDVVRLRQATLPPSKDAGPLDIGPREAWDSHSWNSDWWHGRGWKALYDRWPMVVRLSDRVEIEWFKQVGPVWQYPEASEIAVSGIGTITAARQFGTTVHRSLHVRPVVLSTSKRQDFLEHRFRRRFRAPNYLRSLGLHWARESRNSPYLGRRRP